MKRLLAFIALVLTALISSYAQDLVWVEMAGGTSHDHGYSIATDISGNVYVTGDFRETVDFDPGEGIHILTSAGLYDAFILKLDASGRFLWAVQLGGALSDMGYSIAIDGSGNVHVAGWFQETADFDPGAGTFNLTSAGEQDVFICKLDASGGFVWAKQLGGASADYGWSVALDSGGNVHAAGFFKGTADFDPGEGTFNLTSAGDNDVFICKVDASGNFLWAGKLEGPSADHGYAIAVDGGGNVYTAGNFQMTVDFDPGAGTFNLTSAGMHDVFISKLDASGHFVWARQLGGASREYGHGVAVDGDGYVYATGEFQETADFDPGAGVFNLVSSGDYDAFISKLDPSGDFVWARQLGGGLADHGYAVAVDGAGNVHATGHFQETADFDPGAGTFNLASAGNRDVFISKLDASGGFVWARQLGGGASDYGIAIAVDGAGNVHTTGHFQETADFDPGAGVFNLVSAGGSDVFVHKMSPASLSVPESRLENRLLAYPNPAGGDLVIDLGSRYDQVRVVVRNPLGQAVFSRTYHDGSLVELTLEGEAGVYFITVQAGDERAVLKVVKE